MKWIGICALMAVFAVGLTYPARLLAEDDPFGFDSSLNVYTEVPYSKLPLKSVHSETKIEGPIAKTRVEYTFIDGLKEQMEVGVNFRLPEGAILNGFGYYYGSRFIKGKMYDNDEAWKIYTAVTSRGRDPGIMDRPSQQDYHTQIYPVLPGQYLRVVVELTQQLPTDRSGAQFTLPLTQPDIVSRETEVDATVDIAGHASAIPANFAEHCVSSVSGDHTIIHLSGRWLPRKDWGVTVSRPSGGTWTTAYSRMESGASGPIRHTAQRERRGRHRILSAVNDMESGRRARFFHRRRRSSYFRGAYAATVSTPWNLKNVRIALWGSADTDDASATMFGDVPAYAPISFTGRYRRSGVQRIIVRSSNHRPITVRIALGAKPAAVGADPAARLWADKRISALQDDTTRNRRDEVVSLSKRYTVVSKFTALLAIPAEELENYRKRLAKHDVSTNTEYMGGGGGDPFIQVKAPEDALNVVAVFPDGSAKDLDYDPERKSWTTRFDIPMDTPPGEYDVTVIVVHNDGRRTRFVLVYQNLQEAPVVNGVDAALTAKRGDVAAVSVRTEGVVKATLVTPWGDRVPMKRAADAWTAAPVVPLDWKAGTAQMVIVLYDGAHDRTEVTVDVDIR